MDKRLVILLLTVTFVISSSFAIASHVNWGHSPALRSIPDHTTGEFRVLPDTTPIHGAGNVYRFYLEKEIGIDDFSKEFESYVEEALFHPKSWASDENISLQRIDDRSGDFGITLATPETVDKLCKPLETNGIFSCWNGDRVVINLWRWHAGDENFERLRDYRLYVVNHEVGHALGYDHKRCDETKKLASIMVPQSKDLSDCRSNPWPFPHK